MTKRKGKRARGHASAEESPSCLSRYYDRLGKEIRRIQEEKKRTGGHASAEESPSCLSRYYDRLGKEIRRTQEELNRLKQREKNLQDECRSLRRRLKQKEEEIENSRTDALISFFREMNDEQNNRLLRNLLAFEGDEPALLHYIASYLRDTSGLALEGVIGEQIRLAKDTGDYELQERVSYPCLVRVIGRGISFRGRTIIPIQVELVDEGIEASDEEV